MILKEEFIQDGKRYVLKDWVKDLIFFLQLLSYSFLGLSIIFLLIFLMFIFA